MKNKRFIPRMPHDILQGKQAEFTGKKEGKKKGLTCS